jgi:hypothetical protein
MQLGNINIVCTNKQFQNKVAPLLHSYGAIWQSGRPITQSLGISTDNNLYRVRNNRVSFSPNGASRYQEYLTCKEFLKQYAPLTNEKIFTKFLKHRRKFTWIKNRLIHEELGAVPVRDPFSHIINYAWYEDTRTLALRTEWYALVDTFNITGSVDTSKIFK